MCLLSFLMFNLFGGSALLRAPQLDCPSAVLVTDINALITVVTYVQLMSPTHAFWAGGYNRGTEQLWTWWKCIISAATALEEWYEVCPYNIYPISECGRSISFMGSLRSSEPIIIQRPP